MNQPDRVRGFEAIAYRASEVDTLQQSKEVQFRSDEIKLRPRSLKNSMSYELIKVTYSHISSVCFRSDLVESLQVNYVVHKCFFQTDVLTDNTLIGVSTEIQIGLG